MPGLAGTLGLWQLESEELSSITGLFGSRFRWITRRMPLLRFGCEYVIDDESDTLAVYPTGLMPWEIVSSDGEPFHRLGRWFAERSRPLMQPRGGVLSP